MKNGIYTDGFRRLALLVAAALMVALTIGCGDSECAEGEQLTNFNGDEMCRAECSDDEDCADNEDCRQGFCVVDEDYVPPECNENEDCDDGQECTEDGECVDEVEEISDEDAELCETYCHLVYGCINDSGCNVDNSLVSGLEADCLNGSEDQDGCYEDLTGASADDERERYESLVYGDYDNPDSEQLRDEPNTCDEVAWLRCGSFGLDDACPGCESPANLGSACTADDDCDSGSLLAGVCFQDEDESGGYCAAYSCSIGSEDAVAGDIMHGQGCGSEDGCRAMQGQDGLVGVCHGLCDSNEECDDGTSCQVLGPLFEIEPGVGRVSTGDYVRGCVAQCENADDCGDESRCNDLGICEFACDSEDAEDFCESAGGTCGGAADGGDGGDGGDDGGDGGDGGDGEEPEQEEDVWCVFE